MSISCMKIIHDLNRVVDNANWELINNMTDQKMIYELICVKPNITYEFFYDYLKTNWERLINEFINQPTDCGTITNLIALYHYADPARLAEFRKILDTASQSETKNIFDNINIENLVLDVTASSIMYYTSDDTFEVKHSAPDTIYNLAKILEDHCNCQMVDIFKTIIKKYRKRYQIKFQEKTKEEIIELLRSDYNNFKNILKTISSKDIGIYQTNIFEELATKLTGIYGLSVESELNRLIPDELGSLKQFFIKIITTYYENLHPIIWAQIFKGITENIFVELPYTQDELFAFVSKQLLLNSGPFILKILQMIRPVLTPELAKKYNLTKLTYPKLKLNQVNLILSKAVYDWDMYQVINNFSASVGHVSVVRKADNPANVFIIKIIKPLAVVQTCWEYKTLYNIFPHNPCEQAFVKNMLESNGHELNVNNEISNISRGHEYYTAEYNKVFGTDINAKLTTVQNIPGVVKPDIWYALTMTLAPGIPLSKLVEDDIIKTDTKYRAKLHRCLDLLVYKFFYNIVKNGFYHGDLHAGNIFFSYEQSQMTLIDFGAVGEIDIFSKDPNIKALLEIVVMSIFYNYDEMLDKMTILLNSRCTESQIDMNSQTYIDFKQKLLEYRLQNIRNHEIEKKRSEKYQNDVFSDARIKHEQSQVLEKTQIDYPLYLLPDKSVYSYLEYKPVGDEIIVENRDVLPVFTEIMGDTQSVTFSKVLEMIIKYYSLSGVNIAIKFNDFYEFQKAYALLLGVLTKVQYNSYRAGMAIRKAMINWKNIPELLNIQAVADVAKVYWEENSKFKNIKKQVGYVNQTNSNIVSDSPHGNMIDPNYSKEKYLSGGLNYKMKYFKYKTKYIKTKNNRI